jgi:hypothetical protein
MQWFSGGVYRQNIASRWVTAKILALFGLALGLPWRYILLAEHSVLCAFHDGFVAVKCEGLPQGSPYFDSYLIVPGWS